MIEDETKIMFLVKTRHFYTVLIIDTVLNKQMIHKRLEKMFL